MEEEVDFKERGGEERFGGKGAETAVRMQCMRRIKIKEKYINDEVGVLFLQ